MQRLLLFAMALVLCTGPSFAQSSDLATPGTGPAIKLAPGVSVPLGDAQNLALLYSNGPLVTGTGTGAGGADVSALQTSLGYNSFGTNHNAAAATYVADNFTVPAGGWTVSDFDFYSYQTGGVITTSSFTGVFVQIWNGRPGDAGSTVVFGDLTTNRLASSTFSGIYRVQDTTSPTAATRPIYRNRATIGTLLPAGTYWVQWGSAGSLASGPWAPAVTTPGTIPPGGNARQFAVPLAGPPAVWQDAVDGTIALDFPFLVNGTAGTPTGPQLAATPSSVAFGSVTTGQTSAPRTVTLTNSGTAATTITAITASGAGFTVAAGTLPRTVAAAGTTTFTATFAPTTVGPATGSVSVVSNAAGSPLTVALTGTGVAPTLPGTFPSTDTPLAIPDNVPAGITSTIIVPATATGNIADLDVSLNITHTWVGDFVISLARGTQTATLADRPGLAAGGTGFGCSANNMVVVVNDAGTAGSLETACAGLATGVEAYTAGGQYTPNTPLSVFNSTPRAGSYVLTISDNGFADTGTLNSWALIILGATAGEGTAGASAWRLSVSPNPLAGQGQVNLTVGTAQDVRVSLYDALGREVQVLLARSMQTGEQAYIGFTTSGLPSGVYVVRATGADVNLTQRVTVVR